MAAGELQANLAGVFAPICTPFAANEAVDHGALRFNLARYAESSILGYLALGSNGENRSLAEDEKLRVLDDVVRDRLKVTMLVERVLASPIYQHFTEGAPGLKETAVFGTVLRVLRGHRP